MYPTRQAVTLFCVAAVLACILAGCGPDEKHALRFDGLYRSEADARGDTTYWRYLRFTESGNVLSVSSTASPAEVAAWLHLPYENHGTWRMEEDVLRFACTSPNGTVEYEGTVLQDGLQIRFHSRINDKRGEGTYGFVEVLAEASGP